MSGRVAIAQFRYTDSVSKAADAVRDRGLRLSKGMFEPGICTPGYK